MDGALVGAISVYEMETKEIITQILKRICSIGDTYEKHKENFDYISFSNIQLELLKRIVETEQRITKLRSEVVEDSDKIEKTIERRKLLKLLGTTIAWILLEFNRSYIRNFARGHDPGFISGKKGLRLERLVLESMSESKNHVAILHDLTNCLLTGDLSVIGPKGISTLELKLTKRKKLSSREIRQKRKGQIIREFYDKGVSTKLIPGFKSIRHDLQSRDKYNWNEASAVIKDAIEKGFGLSIVEKCLIYGAFSNENSIDEILHYVEPFKDPVFMVGCHDRHFDPGLPSEMPFTCFEIPISCKEKLLFREINFCIVLELNSLCRILQENGYNCRILKDSDVSPLEVSLTREKEEYIQVSYGLINRLLYECLSVETFINYTSETLDKLKKGLIPEIEP